MTYKRGKKAEKKPRPAICEEMQAVTVQRREALQPSGKFCMESVTKQGIVQGAREGKLLPSEQRELWFYLRNRKVCVVCQVQNLHRDDRNVIGEKQHEA